MQVSINDAMIAQCSAPPSEPANSAFFLVSAIGRRDRSTNVGVEFDAAVFDEKRQAVHHDRA